MMLDWDDLRFFLALARCGTLSAAAKRLNVTQSTVSRRMAAMQERMGVCLLHRTVDGYGLTGAGSRILEHVERVEAEAQSVERALAGYDSRTAGTVRVQCSQLLASHLLAPSFSALHQSHPGITIEVHTNRDSTALTNRKVDIELRLHAFVQPDLVVRKLGTVAMGVYGCISYIAQNGRPTAADGFAGHRFIGGLPTVDEEHDAWLSFHACSAAVVMRTDSFETRYWAAYSGAGLSILPQFMADRQPVLQMISEVPAVPPGTIWQGVQGDCRSMARIRLVLDCVAEAALSRANLLNPMRMAEPLEAGQKVPG